MIPTSCLSTNFILNNKFVSCKAFNAEKLNEGKVIYEVIRIIKGTPLYYQQHVERFYNSVVHSGFKINISTESLAQRVKSLIEQNKLTEGNIRFQVSFDNNNKTTFSAWACPFFYPQKELYIIGASLSTLVAQRNNPNVKIFNPDLINIAFSQINKNNNYEVLYLNKDGVITECSRSNIFFVLGNKIITPTLSSVLPGITRLKAIEIAKDSDIDCVEESINYKSLQLFDGAFITGTSPKVLPVSKIDELIFNPKHPTIIRIMNEYNNLVDEDIETFSWSLFTEN